MSSKLRYFVAVAEAGAIRAAARELNVASSAINRQLLLLEEALGVNLFERIGRGLRLTQAGELLLNEARTSARGFEDAIAAIEALKGLRAGKLRLATVESVSVEIIPALLAEFNAIYPGIEIVLDVAGSDNVTSRVLARSADIGFTFNPASLDGLDVVHEKPMKIGAIMAPDHPLAGNRKVALAACLQHPYAWPARGLSLRNALDLGLRGVDVAVHPVLESNSLRVMAAMARQGRCVAFQTTIGIAQHLENKALRFVPLSDKAVPADRFMIVRQAGRTLGPAAEAFLSFVAKPLSQLI